MRAAALFAAISAANDVREAWFGLATARRRLGDAAGAADALAEALARHVPDRKRAALADAIAREAAAPGWCGLSGDGRLTIHRRPAVGKVELRLDGRRVAMVAGRLPPGWQDARMLAVTTRHGEHLLGSPINIAAITAIVGCVSSRDGALTGWAWHPGDPDADPALTIRAASGGRRADASGGKPITIAAKDASVRIDNSGLLARPRGFIVPAETLKGLTGLLHVRGRDGRDLLGSPLDPRAEQIVGAAAAATLARLYPAARHRAGSRRFAAPPAMPVASGCARRSAGGSAPRPAADVVVPVHDGTARTLACLDSVLATVRRPSRVIVVDDASTDPELIRALDALARQRTGSADPQPAQPGICGECERRNPALPPAATWCC